ncbi:MAG: type I glyceraldehyde-3-phosphate dehydrogenase [bacterium]|nr:type I glyceraldehyde-3-phosphate dehydrogenase [bacterium]
MRIAINGFGRIGRAFFRQAFGQKGFEFVAINDITDPETLSYLLKHDSVYGLFGKPVRADKDALVVSGKRIPVLAIREPDKLPWKKLKVDVVVEASGFFASEEGSRLHLKAGAKRVVITAPAKGNVETVLVRINEEKLKANRLTCNASCTTNAVGPVAAIMSETIGVEKAILNTVHGYTATQNLVDGPPHGEGDKDDMRRGRAAAVNIVPSVTGAAKATAKAVTALQDKFDGVAIRVPVVTGSLIDFTFVAKRPTTVEEVNRIFVRAAKSPRWKGILTVSEESLVSTDIIGNPHASIVDLQLTRVVDGDLVKVFAWYDNEWGYTTTLIEHVKAVGKLL